MGNKYIEADLNTSTPKTVEAYIARKPKSLTAEVQFSSGGGTNNLLVGTTAEWNSQTHLIGRRDIVYVYTDHEHDSQGNPIPAFKVGDGLTYLIDLPFNDDLWLEHIHDTTIHVTEADKEFWNNKVTAYLNAQDLEDLILTKN